jgi:hypothetical protein
MSDLYLRAMLQSMLGGSTSKEDMALLAELCRRIILSGVTISTSGVWSLGLPTFGPSTIANLGTGVIGDLPYFDSTVTLARIADVATGNVLLSGGVGAVPAYGKVTDSHIAAAGLTNAAIAAAAAIAYTKLALTGNIVDADLSASAAVAYSKLASGSALSVLGVAGNAGAVNASIAAGSDNQVLRRSGTAIGFGQVDISQANAVTGVLPTARGGTSVDIASAALPLGSGQITFPAVQNPAAGVNVLDDYEEGTWTPVIGGSGGTSGQAYSVQVGSYIKIGKLVFAQFAAVLSTKGTITTSVQIQGLPFTAENTTNQFSVGALRWGSLATNWVSIIALVSPNTTVADIQGATAAAAGNNTGLATADLGNTSQFIGTIMYRASA